MAGSATLSCVTKLGATFSRSGSLSARSTPVHGVASAAHDNARPRRIHPYRPLFTLPQLLFSLLYSNTYFCFSNKTEPYPKSFKGFSIAAKSPSRSAALKALGNASVTFPLGFHVTVLRVEG